MTSSQNIVLIEAMATQQYLAVIGTPYAECHFTSTTMRFKTIGLGKGLRR